MIDVNRRFGWRPALGRPGGALLRAFAQGSLLLPLVRLFCRPLRVSGVPIPPVPVVFVTNHSSHADTAVLLASLPPGHRRRTAPAAAADYFFSGRVRSVLTRSFIGAFPFPRRGRAGLERAAAHLQRGRSVLLFPEGTRSRDGRVARFQRGVGDLAAGGATIVPVGLAGTREVLPKGARFPRRAAVGVVLGEPMRFVRGAPPDAVAGRLEARVKELACEAELLRPLERPSLFARVGNFARSRGALYVAAIWGIAEAIAWPVVPDFLVFALGVAAPARALPLALAATFGSALGGAGAYALSGSALGESMLGWAPLVTERMVLHAADALDEAGSWGLVQQPLSGVPFKAFALQASAHAELLPFVLTSALVRGARLVTIAGGAAVFGLLFGRLLQRSFLPFFVVYTAVFWRGLMGVVSSWS